MFLLFAWTERVGVGGGGTGAGWLTCCEEWQLVPVPANHPHLCLTCQCPDSVSANQPLNWTQLAPRPNPPIRTTFFKGPFLCLQHHPPSPQHPPILPLTLLLSLHPTVLVEDTFQFLLMYRSQLTLWHAGQSPSSAACHHPGTPLRPHTTPRATSTVTKTL